MRPLKTNLIAQRELHAQSNLSPVNFAKFTLELIMQTFEDFSLWDFDGHFNLDSVHFSLIARSERRECRGNAKRV